MEMRMHCPELIIATNKFDAKEGGRSVMVGTYFIVTATIIYYCTSPPHAFGHLCLPIASPMSPIASPRLSIASPMLTHSITYAFHSITCVRVYKSGVCWLEVSLF